MKAVVALTGLIQLLTASVMNSGPISDRMYAGTPRALLQNPATERVFPFPLSSGHAFDLGHAELVEAVHESETDVDFGGLAIAVS